MPRGYRIGLIVLAVVAIALLSGVGFVSAKIPPASTDLAVPPRGELVVDAAAHGSWRVGEFVVELDDALHVTHPGTAEPVWATVAGSAFIGAAAAEADFIDDLGLLRVRDRQSEVWATQRIESVLDSADGSLVLSGVLEGAGGSLDWQAVLRQGARDRLDLIVSTEPSANRLYVSAALEDDEGVHGFGAQSAGWDLRGQRIPIIPREQGIGRGEQPLSFLVDLAARSAGGQDTTYLPSAANVTDHARSIVYRGDAISSVDLRRADRLTWEVWSDTADFTLAAAQTPAEAAAIQASVTGLAAAPPDWVSTGLIAGLQGGTDEVREKIETLQDAGVPLAAVWLQDWEGRRTTDFGERLQWNWALDKDQYPDWDELVQELADQNIRVLTYVNPYLSADSGEAAAARGGRDLYAEAAAAGYLAVDAGGDVIDADQHGFTAASVDLSNPAAREWFARVIADELAGTGASGWMADFAEGPPPEAVLAGGSGADLRVQWPVLWQQVNQRALELAGLSDDGFVWHRSGGTPSTGTADALWLGDQAQDWSVADGLASTVPLTQSLSASGMAQVHGDIGGYTSIDLPILPDVVRDDELVVRWAEASLLQPVFRTHEGNRPAYSAQPAEDASLAAQLGDLTRVFVALAPERARLNAGGALAGAVQHPRMLAPSADWNSAADHELQLGPNVLLVPVLQPGVTSVEAVLPPGRWQHIWTGEVYGDETSVTTQSVDAPIGQPALFVREGTAVAADLVGFAE